MTISTLPRTGPEREKLRDKGQFFTPAWVADAMVAYAAASTGKLYDPGFGLGAFAEAALRLERKRQSLLEYRGCDTDHTALDRAQAAGLPSRIMDNVELRSFFDIASLPPDTSIISNPPYVRHHRLSESDKARMRALATQHIGKPLDGRAGLHAYFLLHALTLLGEGQRLAFILPSDVCEGVYARTLWAWIAAHFRLSAIVTFTPEATPFPGVDTNAIVLLVTRAKPSAELIWAEVRHANIPDFAAWVADDMPPIESAAIWAQSRTLAEALQTGVSRAPQTGGLHSGYRLGDVLSCIRGIASGANEYFLMSSARVAELGLPTEYFARVVARTRDVSGERVTATDLDTLDREGRPTFLLSLDSATRPTDSPSIAQYIQRGEAAGLPQRPLIAQRRPWFKMEKRKVPPFLFAYLGRRRIRFVRNEANVVPLTAFLCVYPHADLDNTGLDRFQEFLNDEDLDASLRAVGKTYGGGAVKLEPRALEQAPLSHEILRRHPFILALAEASRTARESSQTELLGA